MTGIKAFGKWEAEKLTGNPFATKGSLKVFMSEPKVPLVLDTIGERIAFITLRVASSNRFVLPKSSRSEEEKKRAVYFAIYSPSEEWEIVDGGYSPVSGSSAEELVREMLPLAKNESADPVMNEPDNVDSQALRVLISQSEDKPPYVSFPLTQRQMIEQAAYTMGLTVEAYIEAEIPTKRRRWAYGRFGIDIRASA